MSLFSKNLNDWFSKYKEWVCNNPQTASEVESLVRWLSYFIAGKINKSIILTELVYSASNLLVLFNDIIIQSSTNKIKSFGYKIKIWLSVLEYSEVFMEISIKNLWGEKGKWVIIFCIQLLKCTAKLSLLLHYKEQIISCPAMTPAKRNQINNKNIENFEKTNNIAFSLKRSGKIIRKVDSASSLSSRLWKPPHYVQFEHLEDRLDKRALQQLLIGELLFILKPMVNLVALVKYGPSTWKPWLVSVFIDITSLYLLLNESKNFSKKQYLTTIQNLEISRRRLSLLLYLMRSPFYEEHSKNKIISFLTVLSRKVPLAKIICQPIQTYLPHWQETYFYLWSS